MKDSKWFENKICLITGGTRGIGRAIAEMLLNAGALVVVSGQSQETVNRAVDELMQKWPGKVKGKPADVRDYAAVRELFEHVDGAFERTGRLDVLVNNAGIGTFGSLAALSLAQWEQTIGTNLTGAFLCSREALSRFGTRGGFIVNISSLAGKHAFAGGAAYNASKFGLVGFSDALMLDSRYDNVRVSTILPGSVATGFDRGAQDGSADLGTDWKVHPEDVAAAVRMVLQMPERSLVSQLEIRPSRPKRK